MAFENNIKVTTATPQDVWALGVMVFEAFTRMPAVDPLGGAKGCSALARGEQLYPWESQAQGGAFDNSRARKLVESCLARDPAARPTAAALVGAISMIIDKTRTASEGA